jgi:hypothetical protein
MLTAKQILWLSFKKMDSYSLKNNTYLFFVISV